MSIAIRKSTFQAEDRSWYLGTADMPGFTISGTLDVSAFTSGTHYPDGFFPSGLPLARLSNGLLVPYEAPTNEVQVITPASSGDTTVTFQGVEVGEGALAATAQGAALLQSWLEGGPDIDPGDVTVVAGEDDDAGKLIVTFGGKWAGKNVPQLAVAGTDAAVTTRTQGGAENPAGEGNAVGFLFSSVRVPDPNDTTIDAPCAVLVAFAPVLESRLPFPIDERFKQLVHNIYYVPAGA